MRRARAPRRRVLTPRRALRHGARAAARRAARRRPEPPRAPALEARDAHRQRRGALLLLLCLSPTASQPQLLVHRSCLTTVWSIGFSRASFTRDHMSHLALWGLANCIPSVEQSFLYFDFRYYQRIRI